MSGQMPAWVQAIGSIVAILVAIAVPAWLYIATQRTAKEDRRLKARSLALAI